MSLTFDKQRTEEKIAIELVKQLDGVSIEVARGALRRAGELLWNTRVSSANVLKALAKPD
jgi:hypothetical protein